jgi:hypothetical protein
MKVMRNILMVLLAAILPISAMAQMADQVEVKEVTEKYDLGLAKQPTLQFFDLSRFDISHSYSFGYFSGSGFSGSRALYNGTIRYQIANPLTLTLNLGVLHDPGAIFGDKRLSDNSAFLPSGWLDWRPSKNFRMSIGFESLPAIYHYNRGYYFDTGRFWYSRGR